MDGDRLRQRLAQTGAWLFTVGLVTGVWAALVLTEKVKVAVPRLALASHLNAILGGLWLIAVAWTLEFLWYGEVGRRRLAVLVAIPAWANWLITLIASGLGVRGLEYTDDPANNAVAAALHVLVVLPALVGAAAWAWGFRARPGTVRR